MAQNALRMRNLFELAQTSDEQTFADAKAAFMLLCVEPNLSVEMSSLSAIRVQSGRPTDYVTFKFYGKRNPKRFLLENYEPKTVEFQTERSATKRSIVLHERTDKLGKYICLLKSIEVFLDFAMYLLELFGARVCAIDIDGDHVHHLTRHYSIEKFRDCEHVAISSGTLNSEEMRQMLKFRNNNMLMCAAEQGFELEEPISMSLFATDYAHWLKGPMLMQLDCEEVQVNSFQLQNADINNFLHHLMRKSDLKLGSMNFHKDCRQIEGYTDYDNRYEVKKNWEEEKFDLLKITEGLSSFEQPNVEADVGNKLCFKRTTDKMLITVEVLDYEWKSACYLRITN